MNRPKNYNDIDYEDYAEEHKDELLRSAAAAIDPVKMGMSRQQALTLGGAMKTCGFDRQDFADIMAKSPQDKGIFSSERQWSKFTGEGQHGEAGEGTIFKYAQDCGWKWPAPSADSTPTDSSKGAKRDKVPQLANMARWRDDFKISCIMDSVGYGEKPAKNEVWKIREREQVPTPTPEPMTIQAFAQAVTQGHTFSPTVYSKEEDGKDAEGKTKYKYRTVSQQLFVVDIDNEERVTLDTGEKVTQRIAEPLTMSDALQICKDNGIEPFFYYETFSSKKHRDDPIAPYYKFRLCFALNEPMTAQEYGERGIRETISYFIGLFGKAADGGTTDSARLIFGTDEKERAHLKGVIVDKNKLYAAIHSQADSARLQEEDQAEPSTIPEPVGSFIDIFKQHRNENKQNIRTGIKPLDIALGGGFGNELYIMGAETGTGKSAIASVLAQNIARSGVDVLYYALEMGRDEFIARGTSSISAENNGISNNRAIKYGEILNDTYDSFTEHFYRRPYEQYEQYVAEYARRYGDHFYIIEGGTEGTTAKEIKETAEQFKRERGVMRLAVFVDYLQLLSADPDDKAQRDFLTRMSTAVKVLKTLASQIGAAVFVISSMANDKKGQRVNDASFKYSGDIGYTGGVLLGWNWEDVTTTTNEEKRTLAINTARKTGYREMSLEVLKQRSGEMSSKVHLFYYPAYNYIAEFAPASAEVNNLFGDIRARYKK